MLSNIFTQNVGLLMYCFLPLRKMEGNSNYPVCQRESQVCLYYTDSSNTVTMTV